MILYFTGTNNSKYVADYLGDHLKDEVVAIVDCIKNNRYTLRSTTPYIIVAPIYCYRYPIIIEKFLEEATFLGNSEVYCVGTMQSQTGKTGNVLKSLFTTKQLDYKGFRGIRMPNNYYLVSNRKAPSAYSNQIVVQKAHQAIDEVIDAIQNHAMIKKDDLSPFPYLLTYVFNPLFVKAQLKWTVSDACIQCKKCIQNCPVDNIVLENNQIQFKKQCIQCLRCINTCPKEAINIKHRTINTPRYLCVDYKGEK